MTGTAAFALSGHEHAVVARALTTTTAAAAAVAACFISAISPRRAGRASASSWRRDQPRPQRRRSSFQYPRGWAGRSISTPVTAGAGSGCGRGCSPSNRLEVLNPSLWRMTLVQSNRRLLSHCALDARLDRCVQRACEVEAFEGVRLDFLGRVDDLWCDVRVGRRCG